MFLEVDGEELLDLLVSLRIRAGQLDNMAHECRYRGQDRTASTFAASAARLMRLADRLTVKSLAVPA